MNKNRKIWIPQNKFRHLDFLSGEVWIPTQGKVASPPPAPSEQTNRLRASHWSEAAHAGLWLAASGPGDQIPSEHTCRDPLILATSAQGWQQEGGGGVWLLQYLPQCSPGYKHRTAEHWRRNGKYTQNYKSRIQRPINSTESSLVDLKESISWTGV